MGIYINTFGSSKLAISDNKIAEVISEIFDMRPFFIEKRLKLRNPIYQETAAYGHMGRQPEIKTKKFKSPSGDEKVIEVELFTWENLDYVNIIKEKLKL